MAEVVVIGAGLSGTLMAYELLPQMRKDDRLTVVSQGAVYHFVPSNPWVAIGWRKQSEIEIDLVEVMKRKRIQLLTARRAARAPVGKPDRTWRWNVDQLRLSRDRDRPRFCV